MKTHGESKRGHEPWIRIERRTELTGRPALLLRFGTLLAALVAGGLFVLLLGQNPFAVYGTILSGTFKSSMSIVAMIKIAIPLLICSLGIMLAFRMRFWNIGAEGQLIMGGIFASYFALFCSDWPHLVLIPVMMVAGFVGGAIWALIPAYFKTRFQTNETLFTLMMNYIALYMIQYLREGPWRDPTSPGYSKIARFDTNAQLSQVFGVHSGWIIAVVLLVLTAIYIKYTKHGYEIRVVGESQRTASYAGMNVKKIILRTMLISGGICGLAGMIQVSGADKTLSAGVAGGVGFTAIIVAWMGRLQPVAIFIITMLLSILEKGCGVMQSTLGLSNYVSSALQGIILFTALAMEFFLQYRLVMRKGEKKA